MNSEIPTTWQEFPDDFSPELKAILKSLLNLSENKYTHIAELTIKYIQNGTMPNRNDYKVLLGPFLIAAFLVLLFLFSLFVLPCICIFRKGRPLSGIRRVFCFGVESIILTISCITLIVCLIFYWHMALEVNKISKFYPKILYTMADDLQLAVHHVDNDLQELNAFANDAIDAMSMRVQHLPEKQIAEIETSLGNEFAMYERKSRRALEFLAKPSQFINDNDEVGPEEYNEMHSFVRTSCAFFDKNKRVQQSYDEDLSVPEDRMKRNVSDDVSQQVIDDETSVNKLKEDLYRSLQETVYPNILPNMLEKLKESYEETYELEFGKESLQNSKVDFAEKLQTQKQIRQFDNALLQAKDILSEVRTYTESGSLQWDIDDSNVFQSDIWTIMLLLPSVICIALIAMLVISCLFGIGEMTKAMRTKRDRKCSTVKLLQICFGVLSFLVWIIFLWALIFYLIFSVVALACNVVRYDYIFVRYLDNPNLWNGETWLSHNLKQSRISELLEANEASDDFLTHLKIADVLDQCQRNETLVAIFNLDEFLVNKYFNFTLDINIDQLRRQTRLELKRMAFNNEEKFVKTKEDLRNFTNKLEISLENNIGNMSSNNITILRNYCKIWKKNHDIVVLKEVMDDNYDSMVLYWSLKQIQENLELIEMISIILKEKLYTLEDTSMNNFFTSFNNSIYNDIATLKLNLLELLRTETGKCNILSNVYNFSRKLLCEHVLFAFMGSFLFLSAMGVLFIPILILSFRMNRYLYGTLILDHQKLGKDQRRYSKEMSREIANEINEFNELQLKRTSPNHNTKEDSL